MGKWVVGVDLGGTKLELGLVSPDDRIVDRRRIPTNPQDGVSQLVTRIGQAVDELKAALPAGESIAALGICSPGPVDPAAGLLIDPPNLQGLHNTPLRALLEKALELPVVLEHDANAAALGDFHFGAGRDAEDMAFIVVGTGVGAAIIVDGQLYRGRHGAAGEIGHVTLDRNGEPCSCGNRGCVETFISGPWLGRRYAVERQLPDKRMGGAEVAALAQQGDETARQVMADAGEALGTAVATMAMIVDVDLYVIGGSVAKAGDLLLEPARQAVPGHSFASVGSRVHIVATELGDDGPVLGCAWLARQVS
jgi:glucokinase